MANNIDIFLKKYCPNGVPIVRLEDVCSFNRGSSISANIAISGEIPVIGGGLKPAYYHNVPNRKAGSITVAGSGAYAGYIAYWNRPIWVSDAFTIDPKDDSILTKYVFYCLIGKQGYIYTKQKGAGVPHVHGYDLADMQIPLPPLPVQEEIVRILDTMTALVENIDKEIELVFSYFTQCRNLLVGNNKHKKLVDLLDYEQPTKYIVESTEYNDSVGTPVLTAGQSFVLGYTDENVGVYDASKLNPVIIFDDFTTSFHWVDFPFKVKSSAMKMLRPKKNIEIFKYIYYSMCEIDFTPAEHARHWISKYSQFEIPYPPLDVQQSIVDKLDTFEALIQNLKAERELRQKQYEYYREKLLTFPS